MQVIFAINSSKYQIPVDLKVVAVAQLLNFGMIVELVSIVKVFEQLIKAAKEVAKDLHKIQLDGSDERLEREAELFSMLALQDEPEMTIYSMYNLDNPLIYGVRMSSL
jgi:7tm Chemosensory receptor